MRPRSTLAALTMAALGLALPGPAARAVPYFPSDPGPTFHYESITIYIADGGGTGAFGRSWSFGSPPYLSGSEVFRLDGDGDVLCESVGVVATGMLDIYHFEPPLKYLDFPLETGRTWTSQAELLEDPAPEPTYVTLSGQVLGPATITVPAGTFDVIAVELTYEGPEYGLAPTTGVLYLHHQLGPIGGLVSWTGVVGTGPILWGSLKAAWR